MMRMLKMDQCRWTEFLLVIWKQRSNELVIAWGMHRRFLQGRFAANDVQSRRTNSCASPKETSLTRSSPHFYPHTLCTLPFIEREVITFSIEFLSRDDIFNNKIHVPFCDRDTSLWIDNCIIIAYLVAIFDASSIFLKLNINIIVLAFCIYFAIWPLWNAVGRYFGNFLNGDEILLLVWRIPLVGDHFD